MVRLRTGVLVLVLVLVLAVAAHAQPVDPYAGPSAGSDAAQPVLAEQVAEQLVARAQELLDARMYVNAKQLAVEALVSSPKGNAADHAKFIIKVVNQQLGINDVEPKPPEPSAPLSPPVAPTPQEPIAEPPAAPTPVDEIHGGKTAATVHGAIFGGLIGAAIGSYFDTDSPAAGAVPAGLVVGLVGALAAPRLLHHWDEAQIRTLGAGTVWGGVIGGFFADVVMGGDGGSASGPGVLLGASIGATLGGVGGAAFASDHRLTRGDVALVDTLAGIGTVGGLTIGMLMQPAQAEAYSLNAALGAAGGVLAGIIAAPQTNTTEQRMLRVAGVAAIGGALPFLLYAGVRDPHSTNDERVTGLLSSVGLVGGAWLGFYLTRHFEEGLDVPDGAAKKLDDAPAAIVGRASDGSWQLGGIALQPLSRQLATQHGAAVTLLGGAF